MTEYLMILGITAIYIKGDSGLMVMLRDIL